MCARSRSTNSGRVTGVIYFDAQKREVRQKAKAVVLSANGSESARLLLLSKSARFPDGLANSSGVVGKYLMIGNGAGANALFEHPLNEYKGVISGAGIVDYVPSDPKRGFYGGGRHDGPRLSDTPISYGLNGLSPDAPRWGAGYKKALREEANHRMTITCFVTQLPLETNRVDLDPDVKDEWGLPAMRITLAEPSRRHQEHGVLPAEVHRDSGGGGREEGLGAAGAATAAAARTTAAPAGWATIRRPRWSTSTTRPTTCRTCSLWTAAFWSLAAAITRP